MDKTLQRGMDCGLNLAPQSGCGRQGAAGAALGVGQVTTNITPDKARELLNTARQEATDGQRPVTVAAKYAPLAEAAYALAQTVANLHYEYALQGPDGRWVRETDDRKLELTVDPMRALRRCQPRIIERLAEVASEQFNGECRVVRRLVSDPEVVE